MTPWAGILQAKILEWVAVSFSGESSQPRDQTQVSHITGKFFTSWATREALYTSTLQAIMNILKSIYIQTSISTLWLFHLCVFPPQLAADFEDLKSVLKKSRANKIIFFSFSPSCPMLCKLMSFLREKIAKWRSHPFRALFFQVQMSVNLLFFFFFF